jgi:hypothetical protein
MHDTWLIFIALCMAALGVILLLFALIFMEVPLADISTAGAATDGSMVRVRATVLGTRPLGNETIITISQPQTIDVIIDDKLNISKEDCIYVRGKKESYKGAAQIAATRVSRC